MKQSGGARIINFADWLPVSGHPHVPPILPTLRRDILSTLASIPAINIDEFRDAAALRRGEKFGETAFIDGMSSERL